MKKRIISGLLTAIMALSCMSVNVRAEGLKNNYSGNITIANGDEKDYEGMDLGEEKPELAGSAGETDKSEETDQTEWIEIRTARDLYNIRRNMEGHYKLMNDIDLSEVTAEGGIYDFQGQGWNPIGSNNTYSNIPFEGVFDGQGYSIIGMRIYVGDATSTSYVGLFSNNSGSIKNLNMKNSNISFSSDNHNDIYCGTLAGYNSGLIENIKIFDGSIYLKSFYNTLCSSNETIYVRGAGVVGVTTQSGIVRKCYNEANIQTETKGSYYSSMYKAIVDAYLSGITNGNTNTEIDECMNMGEFDYKHYVSSFGVGSGGVNCKSYRSGISYYGKVSNSFSICKTAEYGICYDTAVNCYFTGSGGRSTNASNCYYLTGSGTSGNGWIGLNKAQMQDSSFFEGFDFENIWYMSEETVYKYPQLRTIRNGITGVEIISEPTNEFVVGTKLYFENAVARVNREDGTYDDIILTPENTTGGNTNTTGIKTVTFTYKGASASFDIEVQPVRVKELSIVSLPNKVNYVVGQPFDQTGLKVNSIFNNGTIQNCEDFAISDVDYSIPGKKTVTVSYNEKSVSFEINYEEKKVTTLEIVTPPSKTVYTRGEEFDRTGMVVKASYNDGTTEIVEDYTVSNISKCGTSVALKVSYGDKEAEINVKVNHKWNAGVRTLEPSCEEEGNIRFTCEYCGYTYDKAIESVGHDFGEPVWIWDEFDSAVAKFVCKTDSSHIKTIDANIASAITKKPTCTSSGVRTYTASVTINGIVYTDSKTEKIPYLTHDFSTAPVWTWNGTSSAVAKFTCKNDNTHTKNVKAVITNKITKKATCTTSGIRTYTATVELNGVTYTNTKDVKIDPLLHNYGAPTWKWNGKSAVATFICKNDKTHLKSVKASVTSKVIKQATCTTSGTVLYTAKVVFKDKTYTATRSVKIEPKGHSFGKPTWKWNGTTGATATFVCTRDKDHKKVVKAKISSKVTTKATLYEAGIRTYTATAELKDKKYTTKKDVKVYLFDKTKTGIQIYNHKIYYVKNGVVLKSFNGFAVYNNKVYYISSGEFDKTVSGLYKGTISGKSGWYVVKAGLYDNSFRGFLSNTYGWWYCNNGTIDFGNTGIYTGTVNGQTADWYVKEGKVTFIDTVARGKDGMYCIRNGRVDYSFTGIASNNEGKWYCVNGKVDTGFSGTVTTVNCIKYTIVNGKVTREEEDTAAELKILLNILYDNTTALNYLSSAVKGISGATTTYGYYYRITYYMDYFKTAKAYIQQAENRCGNITRFATLKNYLHQAAYYIPTTVSNSSASISAFLNCLQTNVYYMELVSNEITRLKNILK